MTICLLSSICGCETSEVTRNNEIVAHEERVANYYSEEKNIVRVIGYNTVFAKDNDEALKLIELRNQLKGNQEKAFLHPIRNIYILIVILFYLAIVVKHYVMAIVGTKLDIQNNELIIELFYVFTSTQTD